YEHDDYKSSDYKVDDYEHKGYGGGYSYGYKTYGSDCDDYSDDYDKGNDYYGHGNDYYSYGKGYDYDYYRRLLLIVRWLQLSREGEQDGATAKSSKETKAEATDKPKGK
ncbi:hypothetical protein PC128_g13957, partial [Phytophthora cactorum]